MSGWHAVKVVEELCRPAGRCVLFATADARLLLTVMVRLEQLRFTVLNAVAVRLYDVTDIVYGDTLRDDAMYAAHNMRFRIMCPRARVHRCW